MGLRPHCGCCFVWNKPRYNYKFHVEVCSRYVILYSHIAMYLESGTRTLDLLASLTGWHWEGKGAQRWGKPSS